MRIEFNDRKTSSLKSIPVKSETNITCTSSFMSGKLLMFAKPSLNSFLYSLVELFCSQVLTDTDSTSFQFIYVTDAANKSDEFRRRFNV